jgi:hypothetical protein
MAQEDGAGTLALRNRVEECVADLAAGRLYRALSGDLAPLDSAWQLEPAGKIGHEPSIVRRVGPKAVIEVGYVQPAAERVQGQQESDRISAAGNSHQAELARRQHGMLLDLAGNLALNPRARHGSIVSLVQRAGLMFWFPRKTLLGS